MATGEATSEREARLKAALKANMDRRKAQGRARAAEDEPVPAPAPEPREDGRDG